MTAQRCIAYQIGLHFAKSSSAGREMPHREGMPMPGAPAAPSRSAPPLPGPSGSC